MAFCGTSSMKFAQFLRRILKLCLIIFCVLVMLVGIIVSCLGAVNTKYLSLLHTNTFSIFANIITIFGLVTVISAGIGIHGVIKDNKYILIILSAVILGCFLFTTTICAVLASLRNNQLSTIIKELLNYQMESSGSGNAFENGELMDFFQNHMACCEIQNIIDWVEGSKMGNLQSIPQCCKSGNSCELVPSIGRNINSTFVLNEGCTKRLSNAFKYINTATNFALSLAIMQMLLFVGSMLHLKGLSNNSHKKRSGKRLFINKSSGGFSKGPGRRAAPSRSCWV